MTLPFYHFCIARQQFGALQHRTFPIYFSISIALSTSLLALWVKSHPSILALATNIGNVKELQELLEVDNVQALVLALVTGMQSANQFVVGPLTSKCIFVILLCNLIGVLTDVVIYDV